jgi:hypothetical protein
MVLSRLDTDSIVTNDDLPVRPINILKSDRYRVSIGVVAFLTSSNTARRGEPINWSPRISSSLARGRNGNLSGCVFFWLSGCGGWSKARRGFYRAGRYLEEHR